MANAAIQPNFWLRELTRARPAQWQWSRALRAAIGVPLPLAFGFITGMVELGVWMSIAMLGLVPAEGSGTYRARFKQVGICFCIGSLGALVGYLHVLPWAAVVLIMAALAFIACIVSSYGAPFSLGSLQALVLASVALGLPELAPYWKPALYYLAGGVVFLLLLGAEALLMRSRPQREMIAGLLNALAQLAEVRAAAASADHTLTETPELESKRREVTTLQSTLYANVLGRRSRRAGRTSEIDGIWATLQSCDTVFAAILSCDNAEKLRCASARLSEIAGNTAAGKKPSQQPDQAAATDPLQHAVESIVSAGLWSHSPFSRLVIDSNSATVPNRSKKPYLSILLDRLMPGRETLRSASALALCIGIAYAAHWYDKDARWYWVPLTVSLIMKPDFGSVFARSLLRSVGTLVGVVVGSLVLLLIPKGIWLIPVMALLAACLPWANQRSYAILAIFVTPLVLVLLDLASPGTVNVNYALQRLLGTVFGAGIVIIFGYFLWPRAHSQEISEAFRTANGTIGAYLQAISNAGQQNNDILDSAAVARARRLAYSKLTDLRTRLQKVLPEPPPAGREALAWFPILASAERICDLVTAYSVKINGTATDNEASRQIKQLSEAIAATPDASHQEIPATDATTALPAAAAELLGKVKSELAFIDRSTGRHSL